MANNITTYIYYQMSNIKQSIKDLIGAEKFEALKNLFASQKFAEVAAKDGSTIVYEGELAEGTPVFVMTAEGNIPAEGVVELADGTVLECSGGVVTKITKMEAKKEDEEKKEVMEGLSPDVEKAIADYVSKVKDELQGQIDELKSMMGEYSKTPDINEKVDKAIEDLNTLLSSKQEEIKGKFSEVENKFKHVVELMEKIADLLAAPAKEEKFEQKTKRETSIRSIADAIKKIQNNK